MKKRILGFTVVSQFFTSGALAHSPTYAYEGLFAGSMICEGEEIGVLFHIEENGHIKRGEFDRVNGTCRSGSGSCNVSKDLKYSGTRKVKGTLDIFPTASNPKTPKARLQITGTGTRVETPASAASAVARPNSFHTSLKIKSSVTHGLFTSDFSELGFRIILNNPRAKPPYDKMFSQIDSRLCHNMTLSRIKEAKP